MKFLLSFVVFGSIALAAAELEDDIDALEVGGAVTIDGKDIREKRALGRIYTGSACEYIKLSDITANSGCADGTKFVLKKADTVRKQLLIMSGTPILAFVTKGTKFVACSSFTEVTMQVDCKTVDGLSDVDLSASSNSSSDERNPDSEEGESVVVTTTTTTATPTTTAPSCAMCGLKTQGKRVVGGEDTEVNEYPWMVGLYMRGSPLPSCGGSLINSKWIITAGHCHTNSHPLTKAVLGEHDIRVTTETQIRIERGINRKIRHPAYNDDTLKNDIALFRLDHPVDTNIYVPVCLPDPGSDYEGKDAWVTGWGTTTENGVQAEILQELELKVVNDGVCYDAMTSKLGTYWGKTFANEQICAGGEAGKDGCQGDSGGPFVHDRGEDVWELIGVVSWGLGCARPGVYGIYTEVEHYLNWIAETLTTEEGKSVSIESIGCV